MVDYKAPCNSNAGQLALHFVKFLHRFRNTMKGIVALAVVALFAASHALTDEQVAKLKEHYDKCTKETGVDKELIVKARKGEFSSDEKLRKYYFCMFKEIGLLNDNGEPQLDVVRQKIPSDVKKEDAEKVIAACKDVKGADKYETAQKIYECYYKTTPQHLTFA